MEAGNYVLFSEVDWPEMPKKDLTKPPSPKSKVVAIFSPKSLNTVPNHYYVCSCYGPSQVRFDDIDKGN
jgi:hypothetical protein